MRRPLALILPFMLLYVCPLVAGDVEGAEDHALLTRYPGSEITWYDTQEFEPYRIAVGPVTGYRKIDDWVESEGKLTRINYVLDGSRGFYEVYANYLNAIKKAGCEIMAKGYVKQSNPRGKVGQRGFLGVHYGANALPPGASQLLKGSSSSGGSGYIAARLERPEGRAYIVVGVTQYSQDRIVAMVDIIEEKPLENDLVTLNAESMARDIERSGKVALYGLYFDHNKATLKQESEPALVEIAKLLGMKPQLQLYVVGHTDMSGNLDYNLRLSEQRAQAVVQALVTTHGIDDSRLQAKGVGPLSPVGSNVTEEGQAKNRRVELVRR